MAPLTADHVHTYYISYTPLFLSWAFILKLTYLVSNPTLNLNLEDEPIYHNSSVIYDV